VPRSSNSINCCLAPAAAAAGSESAAAFIQLAALFAATTWWHAVHLQKHQQHYNCCLRQFLQVCTALQMLARQGWAALLVHQQTQGHLP
jgi:hypothetical protein